MSFLCWCARAPAMLASSPLPPAFWHAALARSARRKLVGPFQVVCSPLCFLLKSLALLVVGGGEVVLASPFLFPGGVEECLVLGTFPPRTVVPWGLPLGPAALFSWGAGGASVGAHQPTTHNNRTQPRTLADWGCALWGRQEDARGGSASCLSDGCPGLGRLPPPTARPSGRRPGSAVRLHWARGVRGLRPVTNPTAHDLASSVCALWRR